MYTPPPIPDDAALLSGLAAGDEAAFNMLFERYRDKLYGYLRKITKSAEVAEEIVVDIFVKLWEGRELAIQIRQMEPFLHKVAYHKAVDFLKTASRHARLQQAYLERLERSSEKTADDLLIDTECRKLLREAVNRLPPKRKLIYTLSREQGLTHDQIAAALNLSRNTVKNTMMAATRSISSFLQHQGLGKAALSLFFLLA
ncbi:RNA polymerase sigma-70 factor [Compostibacter hankyongensis]|uniref:RNA polymerase sigma-70 factor n=1 Tax=Compostibacter hankyongensis TaxID=1007089 RepID=A0ABP8G188_9BACT